MPELRGVREADNGPRHRRHLDGLAAAAGAVEANNQATTGLIRHLHAIFSRVRKYEMCLEATFGLKADADGKMEERKAACVAGCAPTAGLSASGARAFDQPS